MKLLVTGGSGFLGRYVVRQALDAGHGVLALARSPSAAETIVELGAKVLLGDLDDPESIDEAFSGAEADALVNVASLGFGHAPVIVSAAEDAGLRRAVFVSTTAISTTLPAPSKQVRLAAEANIRNSELDWTIVRPTMIYGALGDRNISRLLVLLRRIPLVPVPGGGRRLQQPVHVEDLAQAVLAAVTRDVAIRRSYDVAGPEPMTFRELLVEAGSAAGRHPRLLSVPVRPTIWALAAYERAATHPRIKTEQLERLTEDKAFDISSAIRDLDYHPRAFGVGVRAEAAALWG